MNKDRCGKREVGLVMSGLLCAFVFSPLTITGIAEPTSGKEDSQTDRGSDKVMGQHQVETYDDYEYISGIARDPVRQCVVRPFWGSDTCNGKVHTNDTVHLWPHFSPDLVFHKRVTTTLGCFFIGGDSVQFDEGWGYRGPVIFPPEAVDIRNQSGWSDWGHYDRDSITELTLSGRYIYKRDCGPFMLPGGEIVIRCSPSYIAQAEAREIPESGALYIPGKVWVKASRSRGDLTDGPFPNPDSAYPQRFISEGFEGQLTIASTDTLIIADNVIYKHARFDFSVPGTLDSCSDVLGLVSENFIMIGKDVADSTYIHGALLSLNRAISVQDIYWNRAPEWDNEKVLLTLWGSRGQKYNGITHTTDYPQGHIRGFSHRDYNYDLRFTMTSPPHFPKVHIGMTEPQVIFMAMPEENRAE